MKYDILRTSFAVAALAAVFATGSVAVAADTALPSEAVMASVEATATVTSIDHKTRAVTLKKEDGEELSFVASEDVKNLDQVKQGDVVTLVYAEALAYEVKKGGTTAAPVTVVAGESAAAGQKPEGTVARQTTATIVITAIDPSVPSVTFKGPAGNTKTIKVLHPEKLEGVSVGDTVEITYSEVFSIKVGAAPKK